MENIIESEMDCIKELDGKIAIKVESTGDELNFTMENGDVYSFYHDQDCCEHVVIEDICGDLEDLVGSPLTAYKSSKIGDVGESSTWTFYIFRTIKGTVTVRWLGTSNGFYSEGVSLICRKTNSTRN